MKLGNLETAKSLQELGYNGEYTKTYVDFDNLVDSAIVPGMKMPKEIPAPRLDDAAYFLRDKFRLNIRLNFSRSSGWFYDILNLETDEYLVDIDYYMVATDCLKAALKQAIKLAKEIKK